MWRSVPGFQVQQTSIILHENGIVGGDTDPSEHHCSCWLWGCVLRVFLALSRVPALLRFLPVTPLLLGAPLWWAELSSLLLGARVSCCGSAPRCHTTGVALGAGARIVLCSSSTTAAAAASSSPGCPQERGKCVNVCVGIAGAVEQVFL